MVPFVGCGAVLCKHALFSILWLVWKERKERIFRGLSMSANKLLHLVFLRVAKWASARKEFDCLKAHLVT